MVQMHPSETLLKRFYERFACGDIEGAISMCDESMVYRVPGSLQTSGTYTNTTVGNMLSMVVEISNGTFKEEEFNRAWS